MGAQDKSNPAGEHKARHLIRWFNAGAGGKIAWGTPGDFRQCVAVAGRHMTPDHAKGFCAERHHDVTKEWPGKNAHSGKGGKVHKAEVPAAFVTDQEVHRLDGDVQLIVRPGPELVIVDGEDRVTVTKNLVTVPASSRGRIETREVVGADGSAGVGVKVGEHRANWLPTTGVIAVSTPDGWRAEPITPGDVFVPPAPVLPVAGRVHQWFGKARRVRTPEGQQMFDLPIGSIIPPGGKPKRTVQAPVRSGTMGGVPTTPPPKIGPGGTTWRAGSTLGDVPSTPELEAARRAPRTVPAPVLDRIRANARRLATEDPDIDFDELMGEALRATSPTMNLGKLTPSERGEVEATVELVLEDLDDSGDPPGDATFDREDGELPGDATRDGMAGLRRALTAAERDRAVGGADYNPGTGNGTWGPDDFVVGDEIQTAFDPDGRSRIAEVTGVRPDGVTVTYSDGTGETGFLPWDGIEDNLSAEPIVLPPGYGYKGGRDGFSEWQAANGLPVTEHVDGYEAMPEDDEDLRAVADQPWASDERDAARARLASRGAIDYAFPPGPPPFGSSRRRP